MRASEDVRSKAALPATDSTGLKGLLCLELNAIAPGLQPCDVRDMAEALLDKKYMDKMTEPMAVSS